MKLAFTSCFLLSGLAATFAQPVAKVSDLGAYAIPYASGSNRIELEVLNSTSNPLKDVSVQLSSGPIWLTFETTTASVGILKPGESETATFTFNLDEKAPIGEVTDLNFNVLSATGLLESRTIKIEPEAPTELMLRGNYPNPFNPTTKIAYALPNDGNVRIEVFNPLGQRITRIVDAHPRGRLSGSVVERSYVPERGLFLQRRAKLRGEKEGEAGEDGSPEVDINTPTSNLGLAQAGYFDSSLG